MDCLYLLKKVLTYYWTGNGWSRDAEAALPLTLADITTLVPYPDRLHGVQFQTEMAGSKAMSTSLQDIRKRLDDCPIPHGAVADWDGTEQ